MTKEQKRKEKERKRREKWQESLKRKPESPTWKAVKGLARNTLGEVWFWLVCLTGFMALVGTAIASIVP